MVQLIKQNQYSRKNCSINNILLFEYSSIIHNMKNLGIVYFLQDKNNFKRKNFINNYKNIFKLQRDKEKMKIKKIKFKKHQKINYS